MNVDTQTDAKTLWDQRNAKAREQELMLLAWLREKGSGHNADARENRMSGELVLRVRYKDGGVIGKRIEVHVDEK